MAPNPCLQNASFAPYAHTRPACWDWMHAGTHPEARIGHFTIYGATYYSYVYARCLSSAIWLRMLAHDPLDPGAGEWDLFCSKC